MFRRQYKYDKMDIGLLCKKEMRLMRCSCKYYMCNACNKLKRRLCKQYHVLTDTLEKSSNPIDLSELALKELYRRLEYEYVFDMISYDDILTGIWKDSYKRDKGHQRRLMKLYNMAEENKDDLNVSLVRLLM